MSPGVKSLNIIVGSAGRRLYLLRWFRDALDELGVQGKVIVTESDESSAAFTAGDQGILMPRYSDPSYEAAMLEMVDEFHPAVFVSVNDYELSVLSKGLGDKLRARGTVVPGIADVDIARVTDKFQLEGLLATAGIPTPRTVLASDHEGLERLKLTSEWLVVKDRHGSGSSGLAVVRASFVEETIEHAAAALRNHSRGNPLEQIVVQPYIGGDEFGVDIVGTFDDSEEREYKVFARRKIRMRAGETDKARTLEPKDFMDVATRLGETLAPIGLIDVDILRDCNGTLQIIDVNPRFGGGYPFVHLAGANVPLYYIASLTKTSIGDDWATYESGIISAKFEEARVSGKMP